MANKKTASRTKFVRAGDKASLSIFDGGLVIFTENNRYETAKKWADRRTKAQLVEAVAKLFQRSYDSRREINARVSLAPINERAAAKKAIRDRAKSGGVAKNAKDPKSEAKKCAHELWKERHAGRQPKLRTVEQFAIEVLRRWPILTSTTVIRRWSAEWTKRAKSARK